RTLAAERGQQDYRTALSKVLQTSHDKASAMVQNPLLLYFICLIAFSDESIPDRTAPLIEKCIRELVKWEQFRPGSAWPKPEEFGVDAVFDILGKLALQSFSEETGLVREQTVKNLSEAHRIRFRELLLPARFIEQGESGYKFPLDTL